MTDKMEQRPMKLRAQTAEDCEQIQTENGLRKRMLEFAYRGEFANNIPMACFNLSRQQGLSSEHTAWLIAYNSVCALEDMMSRDLERFNTEPTKPFFIERRPR